MPVLAYRPKLKSRILESQNAAKAPGPILSDTQMTCCLVMGVGGPLVMIAGAVYLFTLHQMDRLLLTSQSKTDMPGFETGVGCLMLCIGGIAGIAGGFFYCEGEKTRRWRAEQEKKKLENRRSSRARSTLTGLETINEGEEMERFEGGNRKSSSRRERGRKGSGRPSRRSSSSTPSEVPSTPMTTTNATSLSELHTYPFSSMDTLNMVQVNADIPPDYSTLFPEEEPTEVLVERNGETVEEDGRG